MRALIVIGTLAAGLGAAAAEPGAPDVPSTHSALAPYWQDRWRGWHFYEDPPPQRPTRRPAPAQQQPSSAPPNQSQVPELAEFDRFRKTIEEARNAAVVHPTEPNVRRYMELEAQMLRQASLFSEVAQRIAWSTPALDMTLEGRPVNARAIEVFDRSERERRGQRVRELASTHALFFIFRSDCPYCHAFAPILNSFQQRHGFSVVPISLDGAGIEPFETYRNDNGIARTLGVTQVPAVFLADTANRRVTPIGFGVLSESQLLERIVSVSEPASNTAVPSFTGSLPTPPLQELP
jgi:conjugal transfer pilus assembly protein TraF